MGCEGASERSYVRFLQTLADAQEANLHLRAELANGGDPLAVVECCAAVSKRLVRQYGRFHHSAVLLDSDKLGQSADRDNRIARVASEAGLTILWQDHDHEAYLLKHIPGQERRAVGRGRSMTELRRFWDSYEKPADALWLASRISLEDWRRMLDANDEHRAFFDHIGLYR